MLSLQIESMKVLYITLLLEYIENNYVYEEKQIVYTCC